MTVKIVHSGGNGVSIAPPDANPASDKTVKLPAANGTLLTTESSPSFRNMVVNGCMTVAQRSVSTAWAANGYLTVDRWYHIINSSDGRFTSKQTADSPDGLGGKCLELDVTTADTSIAAGEHSILQYRFEGQDVQRLAKGTAGAKKFTVSFYVKGNGNATYMCELFDRTNTRLIRQQFAVTSSWSRVTLTFNNETSGGTINNDNSHEFDLQIWLHAGSDFTSGTYTANTWSGQTNANRAVGISSLFSSTDNYFKITGVQMEIGEAATSYEVISYGDELRRCQRYYFKETAVTNGFLSGCGFACNATFGIVHCDFPVVMRAAPTALEQTGTAGVYKLGRRTAATTCSAVPAFDFANTQHAHVLWYVSTGMVAGEGVFMRTTTTDVYLAWSSEL